MPLNKVNYVDGQTVISAQNMNDIQDEVIRLGEKEPIQSDWLETDESSLAYIKNKPFGTAGQYDVICTAEEAATSDKLIEVIINSSHNSWCNNNSNIYYLYDVTPTVWDYLGIAIDQKLAFEESDGFYSTLFERRLGGNRPSLSAYGFANPNISGNIQFGGDVDSAPMHGIVEIKDSTDPAINTGIYICFNSQKETSIKRVLFNRSYLWRYSDSTGLSTIDMPINVNLALKVLEGINYPLQPMIESAIDSLDNKVDKETGKGLSEVNFTKEYEDEIKSIDVLRLNIDNVNIRCGDLEDLAFACSAAAARATEIITNPYGAYLNSQVLTNEVLKINLGENSDKVFVQGNTFFVKLSEKVPSMEEMTKGVTVILSMVSGESPYGNFPSWTPILFPISYIHVGDIRVDNEGWNFINNNAELFNGGKKFLGGWLISIEDSNNEYELPVGIYTTMDMSNLPGIMCSGLQINGFDLSSSIAPASREQVGDISAILDSIIGEEVWTFTLEDGSTVDKVVISSD